MTIQTELTGSGGTGFELVLFAVNPEIVRRASAAGVDAFIVDWECRGKTERQKSADTEINRFGYDELKAVSSATDRRIICRINPVDADTKLEVEAAIEGGAHEVMIPMVESAADVDTVLQQVNGRCQVGILVETVQAVERAPELARLPLSRVYVGLNDLAIQRNSENIFQALADGTVERVRECFQVPFGFGGLTLPDRGRPIPCRLLIGEMARLHCQFSFLRRSFYRDILERCAGWECLGEEVANLKGAISRAFHGSPENAALGHNELLEAIRVWHVTPQATA